MELNIDYLTALVLIFIIVMSLGIVTGFVVFIMGRLLEILLDHLDRKTRRINYD